MSQKALINNEIYKDMGNSWYEGNDYIALLRAESRTRNPWVSSKIKEHFKRTDISILDVGCGAGLLSNSLAKLNYNVTGIDIHSEVINIAHRYDETKKVKYLVANAYSLPFPDESFDVICALDFLEHVEDPQLVLKECARSVKKNGLIFFHTFNRNLFTWAFVIKGMEFFVKRTPKNLHVHHLFIKPSEILDYFKIMKFHLHEIHGLNPKILSKSFLNLVVRGEVNENFEFKMSSSLRAGYIGFVEKY